MELLWKKPPLSQISGTFARCQKKRVKNPTLMPEVPPPRGVAYNWSRISEAPHPIIAPPLPPTPAALKHPPIFSSRASLQHFTITCTPAPVIWCKYYKSAARFRTTSAGSTLRKSLLPLFFPLGQNSIASDASAQVHMAFLKQFENELEEQWIKFGGRW